MTQWLVFCWMVCPIAGFLAAVGRNAGQFGLIAGLFFGPVGVVAALGFDLRPMCPRCGGRLNSSVWISSPQICQHCHVPLKWIGNTPSIAPRPVATVETSPPSATVRHPARKPEHTPPRGPATFGDRVPGDFDLDVPEAGGEMRVAPPPEPPPGPRAIDIYPAYKEPATDPRWRQEGGLR